MLLQKILQNKKLVFAIIVLFVLLFSFFIFRDFVLISAANRNMPRFVALAIHSGANINAQDRYGNTPLILSACNDNSVLMRYLLEQGARIDYANRKGMSSLKAAIIQNDTQMVELLLSRGADPNKSNTKDFSLLMYAVGKKQKTVIKQLIASGADLNKQMPNGVTALFMAVKESQDSIAVELIKSGADVRMPVWNGLNIFQYCAMKNNVYLLDVILDRDKTIINTQTRKGETALICASHVGSYNAAKYLIDSHADVHLRDNKEYTALLWAVGSGNLECIKLLMANDTSWNPGGKIESELIDYHKKKGNNNVVALLLKRAFVRKGNE